MRVLEQPTGVPGASSVNRTHSTNYAELLQEVAVGLFCIYYVLGLFSTLAKFLSELIQACAPSMLTATLATSDYLSINTHEKYSNTFNLANTDNLLYVMYRTRFPMVTTFNSQDIPVSRRSHHLYFTSKDRSRLKTCYSHS